MQDLTAKRTLVKSPPELWSELSEVERLARHLGAFGEIKITKLEPERTVAWEGEGASGTVSIEPSGWGTKVVLTATIEGEEPVPEPEPVVEEVPEESQPLVDEVQEPPVRKRRWLGRLFGWDGRDRVAEQPVWVAGAPAEEPVVVEPEPVAERARADRRGARAGGRHARPRWRPGRAGERLGGARLRAPPPVLARLALRFPLTRAPLDR